MLKKKLLIEVGACDGVDSLRYYNNGYRVFTFEPRKDFFEILNEKTKNIDDFVVIEKAVSLKEGIVKFNICKKGGASSLLEFKSDQELIKHWGANRTDVHYSGISYNVISTRLDTFIEEYKLENEIIDYLHIDAQGVDLDVLKSLGKYIKNVKEGVIETSSSVDKSIYVGQDNIAETAISWLKLNNFVINHVERNDSTDCEYNVYFTASPKNYEITLPQIL
jgi:FkbM family methyltransferase